MFKDIIGGEAQDTEGSMSSVVQPQLSFTPRIAPAQSPEELEERKSKWKELRTKMQDPNMRRALFMAGAYMMQPIQAGQSSLGHLGSAALMGGNAFQMGEETAFNRGLKLRDEEREERKTTSSIAAQEAETKRTVAATPGVQATSDVQVATKDARIEEIQARAKTAKDEAEVKAGEAEIAKRRQAILKDIPDEKIRAAEMAKVDAAALAYQEARARLGLTAAQTAASQESTRASKGKRAQEEITTKLLTDMDEKERKEFLTKTGRYSTHVSSATTARDVYGNIYDGLVKSAPNDPRVKGKTREQFVLDGITSQKSLDASTSLKNYVAAMTTANLDPDPDIIAELSKHIKASAKAKTGEGGPAAPAPAAEPKTAPVRIKDAAGYNALPKGAKYIDPAGNERIKK